MYSLDAIKAMNAAKPAPRKAESPSVYLTLKECADEVRVPVELVRKWCIRFEAGQDGGLPSANFGAKPDGQGERKNRRVLREDWEAFKKARRDGEIRKIRQQVKTLCEPASYGSRAERIAATAGGRGRLLV